VTSGYVLDAVQRFAAASQIATFGVWSHFIHPDDVYDTAENRLSSAYLRNPGNRRWKHKSADGLEALLPAFDSWLTLLRRQLPWLRAMRPTPAARELRRYFASTLEVSDSAEGFRMTCGKGSYLQLRLNDGRRLNPARMSGATLLHSEACGDDMLHILQADAEVVSLHFL
jgi:hypothetical protein